MRLVCVRVRARVRECCVGPGARCVVRGAWCVCVCVCVCVCENSGPSPFKLVLVKSAQVKFVTVSVDGRYSTVSSQVFTVSSDVLLFGETHA